MAKKIQLSYKEIEDRLSSLKHEPVSAEEIGYRILSAFGKGEGEIKRYKEGKGIISTFNGLLIKGLFCYRGTTTLRLASELEEMKQDARVLKAAPKIIAVSDGKTVRAFDLRLQETFEQQVSRLYCDFEFFYPLAGVERIEYVHESPADIKAAEKLAKLHDEIRAYNEFTSDSDLHDLNTFIARLLFCYFAEDTGIFADNVFSGAIRRFTKDALNLKETLEQIFRFMGGKPIPAGMLQTYCQSNFGIVGGGLFERNIYIPELSNKARQIIIECGELDWQNINPDIFGSMIQAVVNPDVRANQGMHYTSVPNIMKVINPLFLDELREAYNALMTEYDILRKSKDIGEIGEKQFYDKCKTIEKKSRQLLLRMSKMKFFDPACGSGNFLIITYKMLRLLEMDIWSLISKCNPYGALQFVDGSVISIEQFYGIELLDFPHEVAMLSLWLAEHQMNKKMREDFGVNTNALPLRDIHNIRCGNACRLDWNEVCPHTKDEEVFVFGNPPYLGYVLQSNTQKYDIESNFKDITDYKKLDYISVWFFKGVNFISNTNAEFAFVSTNSICQGEHIGLLWPSLLRNDVRIKFAYKSFKWTNNAKYNAGVTCVIIGFSSRNSEYKLFDGEKVKICAKINPYLTDSDISIISNKSKPISFTDEMQKGSQAADGGNLFLDWEEKNKLIETFPEIHDLIKQSMGSEEFINGKVRFCLWIEEEEKEIAYKNPFISKRLYNVKEMRLASSKAATREWAERPYMFTERRYKNSSCIIVPSTSSERREYIPMGYLDDGVVVTNSAFAIYDAPVELFGILTSRIHMDWVRAVGGRLETRYRYSNTLCYNTFPFPPISDEKKAEIEEAATNVLVAREPYLTVGKTLADLYDPDKMPDDLREAHHRLDDIVESCYPGYPFSSDEARLECLFKMYEKMTSK